LLSFIFPGGSLGKFEHVRESVVMQFYAWKRRDLYLPKYRAPLRDST
ncbi:hypothetical protein BAE44_0007927, partial [Dichanthelium oligosanthes]